MSGLYDVEPPAPLTPEQRQQFIDLIRADKTRALGHKQALRKLGIKGTGAQLHALLDDELLEDAQLARGWNIRAVEQTTWTVAQDPDHPAWQRANALLLKAYGGVQFRDRQAVELSGPEGGPIETEDRSASLQDVLAVIETHVKEDDGGDGSDGSGSDVA